LFTQLQLDLRQVFRRPLIHKPVIIPCALAELKRNADYLHVLFAPVLVLEPDLLLYHFGGVLLQIFIACKLLVQLLHDQARFVLYQVGLDALSLITTGFVHQFEKGCDCQLDDPVNVAKYFAKILVKEF
jgi:hypothetical protein